MSNYTDRYVTLGLSSILGSTIKMWVCRYSLFSYIMCKLLMIYTSLKVWFAIALIHPINTHFQARSGRLHSLLVTQYMANTLPLDGISLLNFWLITTSKVIAPTVIRKEIANWILRLGFLSWFSKN